MTLGASACRVTSWLCDLAVHFLTDGAAGELDGPRSSFRHRVFYVGRDTRTLASLGAGRGTEPAILPSYRSSRPWTLCAGGSRPQAGRPVAVARPEAVRSFT
jgi:hypothetical protein